jgi:ATP-dependent Clp protease ATP-binding subunit ClpC
VFERYSEDARRSVFFAHYEASTRNAKTIEAEHLLLGILRENPRWLDSNLSLGATGRIQNSLGTQTFPMESEQLFHKRTWVPDWLWSLVAEGGASPRRDLPLSNECKRILAYTAEEAERLGSRAITFIHLLLGILRESNSKAAQALSAQGITLDRVRATAPWS